MKTRLGLAGLALISLMSCNIKIPIVEQKPATVKTSPRPSSNTYEYKIEKIGTYEDEYSKTEIYSVTDNNGKVHRMTKRSGTPRAPDIYAGR